MINADNTIIFDQTGLGLNNTSLVDFNDIDDANLYNFNGLAQSLAGTSLAGVGLALETILVLDPRLTPSSETISNRLALAIDASIDIDIRNPLVINTFRFKFTDQFMDSLFHFSKVHQYDDRHAFKDAWTTWTDENAALVQTEVERLNQLGYTGNVIEKMFKSARYYFRKKDVCATVSAPRKQYTRINKDIIDCIDAHIKSHLVAHSLKPQDGFIDFCEKCADDFASAARILENAGLNNAEIDDKIKKTYKNRYSKIAAVAKR